MKPLKGDFMKALFLTMLTGILLSNPAAQACLSPPLIESTNNMATALKSYQQASLETGFYGRVLSIRESGKLEYSLTVADGNKTKEVSVKLKYPPRDTNEAIPAGGCGQRPVLDEIR